MAHVEADWAGDRLFLFRCDLWVKKAQKEASYSVLVDCVAQTERAEGFEPPPTKTVELQQRNRRRIWAPSLSIIAPFSRDTALWPRHQIKEQQADMEAYTAVLRNPCRWRRKRKLNMFDELAVQGRVPLE